MMMRSRSTSSASLIRRRRSKLQQQGVLLCKLFFAARFLFFLHHNNNDLFLDVKAESNGNIFNEPITSSKPSSLALASDKVVATTANSHNNNNNDGSCTAETTSTSASTTTTSTCSASLQQEQQQPQEQSEQQKLSIEKKIFQNIHSTFQHWLHSSPSVTVPSYYLLWSAGSFKKLISSTLWLAVFHVYKDWIWNFIITTTTTTIFPTNFLLSFAQNWLLPLLSSACCAIQLILNMIGIGCAGFNTYLGPVRPYFITLLLYLSFIVYPPPSVMMMSVTDIVGIITRFAMAVLPEIVHLWNAYYYQTIISTTTSGRNDLLTQQSMTLNNYDANNRIQATVEFIVPTMGCVACINKINSSILQSFSNNHKNEENNQLVEGSSKAWLLPPPNKGGKSSVTLTATDETELHTLIEQVQNAIHRAGFDHTSVDSIQRLEPTKQQQQQQQQVLSAIKSGEKGGGPSRQKSINDNLQTISSITTKINFFIPTMSCHGCIAEINTAAQQVSSKIVDVSSWLLEDDDVGGKASLTVVVSSKQELDHILQEVQNAWMATGFYDNELKSMEFSTSSSSSSNSRSAIASATTISTNILATAIFAVPSMNCRGCISKIDSIVRERHPQHVKNVSSNLLNEGGGKTKIEFTTGSPEEVEWIITSLEQSIHSKGFNDLQLENLEWIVVQKEEVS